MEAVATHGTAIGNDLAADRRWPRWAPTVIERLGVRAMMSLLSFTNNREYGAFNIYANRPNVFTAEDLSIA